LKHVLVLTHSGDRYVVERVMAAVERRGARAHRFDTDLFPSETRLAAWFGGSRRAVLRSGDRSIDLAEIDAVWARRIWPPRIDERVEPKLREGAVRESAAALAGVLDALHRAAWIDAPDLVRAASDKLRQLRLAEEAGLEVPPTLVTNDPDEVRAFHDEHREIVAKMLTPLSVGMEHQEFFVRTSRVRAEDLEHLDALRHAPMVFQALVPKAIELRVACVGRRAFAGAIDASRSERGKVDWRLARPDEVRWERAEVPDGVAARIFELLRAFGLRFGAVDLIRRPDGAHIFLEVNPTGEWGMLERDLGLPISEVLAEELVSERPRSERKVETCAP